MVRALRRAAPMPHRPRPRHLVLPALLAAACGSGPESMPDAAEARPDASTVGDAGADAPIDAPAAPVRLQVSRPDSSGAPDQGITVLFHDRAGALIARAVTDAAGHAEHAVTAGGSVTVFQRRDGAPLITTIAAVEPDDRLVVSHLQPTFHEDRAARKVRVKGDWTNGIGYMMHARCAAPRPWYGHGYTTELLVDAACSGPTTDITAVDLFSYPGGRYAHRAGVPLGTTDVVEMTEDASLGITSVQLRGMTGDALMRSGVAAGPQVLARVERYRPRQDEAPVDVEYVPTLGDSRWIRVQALRGHRAWTAKAAQLAESYVADVTTLPALDGQAPAIEGRGLRWSLSSADGHDAVVATAGWGANRWRFVLPPGSVGAFVPELPPDLVGLSPVGAAVSLSVSAIEIDAIDGWRAFRPRASSLADADLFPEQLPEASMTIRVSSSQELP